MCGKFTAMGSWRKVWDFSQPLGNRAREYGGGGDEVVTYRVGGPLPVIIYDHEAKQRRVVPMRWGFPDAAHPARPAHIHVRSETIDTKKAFASAFLEGQRGIVVMRTFNEGEDIKNDAGKIVRTDQWTIDPLDGDPRSFAFLWRSFDLPGSTAPILACVMCTVPANKLIMPVTDRMPAILNDADWSKWLDEAPISPDDAKSLLKTMEGVTWQMTKEEKKPRPSNPPRPKAPKKKPESPQGDLF